MRLIRPVFWSAAGLLIIAILLLTIERSQLLSLGFIFTMGGILGTGIFFMNWQKTRRVYNVERLKSMQHIDVSHENQAPPAILHATIQTLQNMGFRRLGEEATLEAEGSELARTWVFVSSDERVTAALLPSRLVQGGALIQLQTLFPGPSWLKTIYPSGFPYSETITLPDFWVRYTRHSLEKAHNLHRTAMAEFAQQQGDPVHIHTMADTQAYGPVFRERHIERFFQRNLLIPRLNLYFMGGMTVLFLIGTALSGIAPKLALLIFVLGLGAVFLHMSIMTR